MTEKCFDIGTIQAFLDGELAADGLETVSRHIAMCDDCAMMLAEAEEETAFAFSALEQEFNTFVPTNRLWTKINDSIEGSKKTFWQSVLARFSNPTVAAFASLVIVGGLFVAMLSVKTNDDKSNVAGIIPDKPKVTLPISKPETVAAGIQSFEKNSPQITKARSIETSTNSNDKPKYAVVKTTFTEREDNRQPRRQNTVERNSNPPINAESNTNSGNLLGEESYVKTIATLTKTVNSSKDEVLKPSARFAFERDLAVTNDAIKKMKAEVAKNPKNEAAKDVLRASYQNKIDLLNSVAEKSELMASVK